MSGDDIFSVLVVSILYFCFDICSLQFLLLMLLLVFFCVCQDDDDDDDDDGSNNPAGFAIGSASTVIGSLVLCRDVQALCCHFFLSHLST